MIINQTDRLVNPEKLIIKSLRDKYTEEEVQTGKGGARCAGGYHDDMET